MEIEVIWENGVFRPLRQISLKRSRVTIQVPDEAIGSSPGTDEGVASSQYVLSPEAHRIAQEMQAQLERIRNAPFPPDEELPPVTQKQLDRIVAFATREDQ